MFENTCTVYSKINNYQQISPCKLFIKPYGHSKKHYFIIKIDFNISIAHN